MLKSRKEKNMPRYKKEKMNAQKFTEESLNDPVVRAKLERFIKSSIELLEQINTYKESYKDLKDEISIDIGIGKRLLNRIAKYAFLKQKENDKLAEEMKNINLVENILTLLSKKYTKEY